MEKNKLQNVTTKYLFIRLKKISPNIVGRDSYIKMF